MVDASIICSLQIELSVAVSHRNTPYGRKRTGLCSGFLSRLAPGDVVHVSIKPGSIRGTSLSRGAPAASGEGGYNADVRIVPNILVGPGTGVAPMRALIQHEVARQTLACRRVAEAHPFGSASLPTPNTVLFFGCRKQERDHLYAADWAQVNSHRNPFTPEAGFTHVPYVTELQPGAVVVSSAFSQDQLVKVYVTHKIKEQGELVCRMLQQVHFASSIFSPIRRHKTVDSTLNFCVVVQGANVFVVGSSKRMPADVRKALCAALEEHAGLSPAESDAYLLKLAKAKKYVVEAW